MQAPTDKNIFLITAIHSTSDGRVFGWYGSLKEAQEAVGENRLDLCEANYYSHLVIEEMAPGIHSQVQNEWWYCFQDGRWQVCQKPSWAKHITNWSLG